MDRSRVVGVRGIVITDMVDSSRLRSELGDRRADDLRRDHDALLASAVADHDGRVLRWTGDGVKADFASASAAVAAAMDMQRAVRRYGRSAAAVVPFEIRVGASVGEVTDEDDDVHGVAVIEAARLEAMASPGEILVTDLVERLGQRRVDAAFEEVGTHALKGLDQPVTVLRVIDTGTASGARPMPRVLALDGRFPLVGRRRDLELAVGRWHEVVTGGRQRPTAAILVAGEPGIGKSRFLAQVADRAHADGGLVLAGACDSDLAVPYQPFAAALADVAALDDELQQALASGAGELGPLFPGRRTGRFEDAGPSARFELFEAVASLIERLASDQPIVLVLEDLQWATPPTVQLLRHLLRHRSMTRALVLASYRVEDVTAGHPLHALLADARLSDAVTRVELEPLGPSDVAELVAARAPDAPPANVTDFASRLHEESGGRAFFVCELLEHLSGTGELERLVGHGGAAALPVPDSVRDVVGQRLGRLPSGAADVLSTAAVIGMVFDLDVLTSLGGRPAEDVLALLEDAERAALVHEVDAGRFTFAHAIVRSTLVDSMSATRRALSHRRVAEAIEALGRPDHDELAHHWSMAGVDDKAFVHLELAARRDLDALAYESAAERYQAVVDHERRTPSADQSALARAWLGLGLARRALGQPDYVAAIEQAGRLGRRLHDVDVVAEAAIASVWPGTFFVSAGRAPTGLVELCDDALQIVDDDDPRRARILSTLAAHLTFDSDRARRTDLLDAALALAQRLGDPELIGGVLVAEHLALWDPTTAGRRAEIAIAVGRMARASGDVDLEFYAGFFTAIGAAERCDVAGARQELAALAGPVATSRNFYFGFLVERLSASLDVLCGEPGARARIDALAQRYTGTHADTSGTWALQTGGLALQAGTLGDLLPAVRTMVEQSELGTTWTAPYGLALLHAGDRDSAAELLDGFVEPQLDYFWLTTMQIVGQLAAELDRRPEARRIFDCLLPHRDQLGITASGSLCLGLVATTLGELAVVLGEDAAAVELLEGAVTTADTIGAPFEAVRSRRLLATAHRAAGRANDAAPLVEAALPMARRHGFAGEERLLGALGEPNALRRA